MPPRRAESSGSTKPMDLKQILKMMIGIAVTLGLLLASAPSIGNAFRIPARMDEYERSRNDTDRRLTALEQAVREQGKEVSGIGGRLDKFEKTYEDGQNRTEQTLMKLTERFADVSASARLMERAVSDALAISQQSRATANNAVVRADQAIDAVEGKANK